jgi:hypothetical protein
MRCRSGIFGGFSGFRDRGLQATGEFATRQQDPPTATKTLQTDVGAQAHHDPIGAAAGMRFSEPEHVCHLKVR